MGIGSALLVNAVFMVQRYGSPDPAALQAWGWVLMAAGIVGVIVGIYTAASLFDRMDTGIGRKLNQMDQKLDKLSESSAS